MTDRTDGTALPPFEAEFARAWNTPGHPRYHLPDTDINEVLATRYTVSALLTLTRPEISGRHQMNDTRTESTGMTYVL